MQPLSLYVHIPFCTHKCHYCDFNTYAGIEHLIPPYLDALETELTLWAPTLADHEVRTIFFGGGTPSLLSSEQMRHFLDLCRERLNVTPDAEITMEANPGTVTLEKLAGYRESGVNRLSYGAQSFQPDELAWLGRQHSVNDIGEAVRLARQAGFRRLNLDLIYGLPEQKVEPWEKTLNDVLPLQPDHLSLYALTIEEGTPLGKWLDEGRITTPDGDIAADQYLLAAEMMGAAGYQQYEISNWAKPGEECRHNLTYWRNQQYLGIGAGAHSCFGGYRFNDILLPQEYIRRVKENAAAPHAHHPLAFDVAQDERAVGANNLSSPNVDRRSPDRLDETRSLNPTNPPQPNVDRGSRPDRPDGLPDNLGIPNQQGQVTLPTIDSGEHRFDQPHDQHPLILSGVEGERRDGNERSVEATIRALSPIADAYPVDEEMALQDSLILGLRLNEGMRFDEIEQRHNVDVRARYGSVLAEVTELGLLEQDETSMRLTPRGRLLANEVFVRLLEA